MSQIFIGKAKKQTESGAQQSSKSYKCYSEKSVINDGSLVAVYLPKYPEFPQIGQVQCSNDESITISWYDGTFNDIWTLVKLKKGLEWKETIKKTSILLYDLVLTKGQRLKKDCNQFLREYYENSVSNEQ